MIIEGSYTEVKVEGTKIVIRRYIRKMGKMDYEEDWKSPLSVINTENQSVQDALKSLGWVKTGEKE